MPRKTLELIVNDKTKTIQPKSLLKALLAGLSRETFDKYKSHRVLGYRSYGTSYGEPVTPTLAQYLQYLLSEKTLSCYAKSRPEGADGDKIFYPTAKDYITRYPWSAVKMTEEQLFWIHNGE